MNAEARRQALIRQAARGKLELLASLIQGIRGGEVTIEAAAGDDGSDLPRFSMIAYTGGPMNVGYGDPVIVDLDGMDISRQRRPTFRDHDTGRIVGNTDSIVVRDGELEASGVLSGANADTQELVGLAKNGFPMQASIGAKIERLVFVGEGEAVDVNGRTFDGPVLVARKSTLKEISFVPLGADDNTVVTVAAGFNPKEMEILTMDFETWLRLEFGLVLGDLSDDQKNKLRAKYDREQALKASTNTDGDKAKSQKPAPIQAGDDADQRAARLKAEREVEAAEFDRITKIKAMQDAEFQDDGDGHKKGESIKAHAIREGWDLTRTELAILKASRPTAPHVSISADSHHHPLEHLECAAVLASGQSDVLERSYKPEQIERAIRAHGRTGVMPQQIILAAAHAGGYRGTGNFRDSGELKTMLQAAFSTNEISGILSNVANKFLVRGFDAVEAAWRRITATRPASDFKEMTGYRLTDDLKYQKVGNSGKIEHGTVGEAVYGNKVDTHARMLSVTRQDLINDDLGALTVIPQRLGRGAGLAINDVFWTEWLDDATFFTVGNNNLESASLSLAGLDVLNTALRRQTDENGNPLGIRAALLVVPASLETTALKLMRSTTVNLQPDSAAGSPSDFPDANVFAGRYEVVSSSYLDDASLTAWYLMASPLDIPAIETAFLNGQETPTIETADADFNVLGIQMRGYSDFGVRKQEYRAAQKSTGV